VYKLPERDLSVVPVVPVRVTAPRDPPDSLFVADDRPVRVPSVGESAPLVPASVVVPAFDVVVVLPRTTERVVILSVILSSLPANEDRPPLETPVPLPDRLPLPPVLPASELREIVEPRGRYGLPTAYPRPPQE